MFPCIPYMLCITLPLVFARLVPCFAQGVSLCKRGMPTIEVLQGTFPAAGVVALGLRAVCGEDSAARLDRQGLASDRGGGLKRSLL